MFLKASEARDIYQLIENGRYQDATISLSQQKENAETHFLKGLIFMNKGPHKQALTEFNSTLKQTQDTELKLYTYIQLGYLNYKIAQEKRQEQLKIVARQAWEKALANLGELVRNTPPTPRSLDVRTHCQETANVWIDLLRLYNQQGFLLTANFNAFELETYYKNRTDTPYIQTLQAEIKLAKVCFIWSKFQTSTDSLNELHFAAIIEFEKALRLDPQMVAVRTIDDEYRKLLSNSKALNPAAYDRYLAAAINFAESNHISADYQNISTPESLQTKQDSSTTRLSTII